MPAIIPLTGSVGNGGKDLGRRPIPTGKVCPGDRDYPKVKSDRSPYDRR